MRRWPHLLSAALLALAAVLSGCGQGDARAWIEASRAQSEAAASAPDGRVEQAALERLLALEVPDSVAPTDARVVRQDAHERLGRLMLRRGEDARALQEVEAGLALGEADDIFTANLLVLRGRIREHQGEEVDAARDYHRALLIHETLLEGALGGQR